MAASGWPSLHGVAAFSFVAIAAASLASFMQKHMGFPLITGYILSGVLAGPCVLALLSHEECVQLGHGINQNAMGYIGFAAGSKFLLSDLRGTIRPTLLLLLSVIVATWLIVFAGIWLCSPVLQITAGASDSHRLAVAMLIACLCVARSPSSAIALVTELDARGPFTTAALSITVLSDVVVVVLFGFTLLILKQLDPDEGVPPAPASLVLLLFAVQIATSLLAGLAIGQGLHFFFSISNAAVGLPERIATRVAAALGAPIPRRPGLGTAGQPKRRGVLRAAATSLASLVAAAKMGVLITETVCLNLSGFVVFEGEEWELHQYGLAIHQPLIISMVAGFTLTNLTSSRRTFMRVLHASSAPVYIAFFTLTGMLLQLDSLLGNLPAAALICVLRLAGIVAGSRVGGAWGGAESGHCERYWMVFITQAGVTLGLIVQAEESLNWGPAFGTCVTAAVVLNQLIGPPLFKAATIAVGEAHCAYQPAEGPTPVGVLAPLRPQPRAALIVSSDADPEALALRERLEARGWQLVHLDPTRPLSTQYASHPRSERRSRRFGRLLQRAAPALQEQWRKQSGAGQSGAGQSGAGGGAVDGSRAGRRAQEGHGGLRASLLGSRATEEGFEDSVQELALLWGVCSLESLDVVALLLRDDEDNLRLCKVLSSIEASFPELRAHQPSAAQLLVRLNEPSCEAVYRETPLSAFRLLLVGVPAAMPNLYAELLHPEGHWSLELKNALPLKCTPDLVRRSFTSGELRLATSCFDGTWLDVAEDLETPTAEGYESA